MKATLSFLVAAAYCATFIFLLGMPLSCFQTRGAPVTNVELAVYGISALGLVVLALSLLYAWRDLQRD